MHYKFLIHYISSRSGSVHLVGRFWSTGSCLLIITDYSSGSEVNISRGRINLNSTVMWICFILYKAASITRYAHTNALSYERLIKTSFIINAFEKMYTPSHH
jgi:hypothetical protein